MEGVVAHTAVAQSSGVEPSGLGRAQQGLTAPPTTLAVGAHLPSTHAVVQVCTCVQFALTLCAAPRLPCGMQGLTQGPPAPSAGLLRLGIQAAEPQSTQAATTCNPLPHIRAALLSCVCGLRFGAG